MCDGQYQEKIEAVFFMASSPQILLSRKFSKDAIICPQKLSVAVTLNVPFIHFWLFNLQGCV